MSRVDRGLADEAVNIVTSDRPGAYGPPEDNFRHIAYGWAGVLAAKFGREFDPYELVNHPEVVSLMMVSLKVMREAYKHKRDNVVDGIGYWLTTDAVTVKAESLPEVKPLNIISVGERPSLQMEDDKSTSVISEFGTLTGTYDYSYLSSDPYLTSDESRDKKDSFTAQRFITHAVSAKHDNCGCPLSTPVLDITP